MEKRTIEQSRPVSALAKLRIAKKKIFSQQLQLTINKLARKWTILLFSILRLSMS